MDLVDAILWPFERWARFVAKLWGVDAPELPQFDDEADDPGIEPGPSG